MQTVYNVVGAKAVLVKAVYDVALAGDDEPMPMGERPMFVAMATARDGRDCLALYAGIGRVLGERVLPLVSMLLSQAATGDAELRSFAETIEGERAVGTRLTAEHVARRFGLRDALGVGEAADVLWALTAPDLADRLVHRRGWGWDAFETWLGATMADALLGPTTAGAGATRQPVG